VTSYNGRWWINEFDRVGPVWGSFASRDAAVAAGRVLAIDASTTHVIQDETGAVIEAASYKAASCLTCRSEPFKASSPAVRKRQLAMSSRA
jgi:hypothetical protein